MRVGSKCIHTSMPATSQKVDRGSISPVVAFLAISHTVLLNSSPRDEASKSSGSTFSSGSGGYSTSRLYSCTMPFSTVAEISTALWSTRVTSVKFKTVSK